MASLPPLPSEVFAEKVLTAQTSSTEAAARATYERPCDACRKTYYSKNAFQNHLGSQKHKARLAAIHEGTKGGGDVETESILSSTFSLGDPIETSAPAVGHDPEAEEEFSKVVNGIKETSIQDDELVPSRPTRPHHSAGTDKPEHPLSERATPASSTAAPSSAEVLSTCLFCNYRSPSIPLSVSHMSRFHGMFIPEQSYLVDLEGLIRYLSNKIHEFHECLYCTKVKGTTAGIQTHMRDKGHCMIAFDSEEEMIEVGQFYDFRGTYSDSESEDETDDPQPAKTIRPAARLGAKRSEDEVDGEHETADGDGWETDSSASSLDSAELTAVPLDHTHQYQKLQKHPHHSHHDPRPHHNKDGWHSHAHTHPHAVYYADYELHLPSGRSVGHRSLARYYRQNLHNSSLNESQADRRAITDGSSTESEGQALQQRQGRGRQMVTRANGGLGMAGVTEAKKREIKAVEKRERKRENRQRLRYQWGVDKRGNSQKHFRVRAHLMSDSCHCTNVSAGSSVAVNCGVVAPQGETSTFQCTFANRSRRRIDRKPC